MKLHLARLLCAFPPLVFRRFTRMAPLPQHAHVLCVGRGAVANLAYIARTHKPASVTALVTDAAVATAAQPLLKTLPGTTAVITANPAAVPLPAHHYDVILSTCALHKQPEWRRTIAEYARLLHQGGLLYIMDIHTPAIGRSALRDGLAHHGFVPLGAVAAPAKSANFLQRTFGRRTSLIAMRLAITQPEYD